MIELLLLILLVWFACCVMVVSLCAMASRGDRQQVVDFTSTTPQSGTVRRAVRSDRRA